MKTLTLDDNNGLPSFDDLELSFGEIEEEVVTEDTILEPDEKKEEEEEVVEKKKEEVKVKLETTTLDELENIPNVEEDELLEVEESKEKTKEEVPYLSAIKAVLEKKMERYGVDTEAIDLSEMDEDDLVEFEEKLDNAIISNRYNNVKNQNKHIKAIMDFAEKGGDPSQIASLFEQQKEIASIDKTTPEGKIEYIKSYYKDALGWDATKVAQKIERIEAQDNIDNEFSDIESEYDKYFDKVIGEKQKKQEEINTRKLLVEQKRQEVFHSVLDSNKIPDKKKHDYLTTAFGEGTIKGTNEKVKVLDYTIERIKNDPNQFLKLVQFVTNMDDYDKQIAQLAKNEKVVTETKKGFNITTKKKESTIVEDKSTKTPNFKFNF